MLHPNARIYNQTQYYKKIQMRICVNCTRVAVEDRVVCAYHKKYQKQYMKKRIANRKIRGVCFVCKEPANKVFNGKTMCAKHRRIARERTRAQVKLHKSLGLCRKCKAAPAQDRTMCEKHLAELRASGRRMYAKKKLAN